MVPSATKKTLKVDLDCHNQLIVIFYLQNMIVLVRLRLDNTNQTYDINFCSFEISKSCSKLLLGCNENQSLFWLLRFITN